jgi:antitoxin component YwqK of YwqJK toxin-antitoxin module
MTRILKCLVLIIVPIYLYSQNEDTSEIIRKNEYYSCSNKVKKVYYYNSLMKLHPKVSMYRRNGSLKLDYFYDNGNYLFSLKYSTTGEVIRERGLKIDKSHSSYRYNIDSSRVTNTKVNQFDSNGKKSFRWYESEFVLDLNGLSYKNIYLTGTYIEGFKNGKWMYYHKYGNQLYQTIEYQSGIINGLVTFYNRSGIITSKYEYSKGIKHGKYYSYYNSGELREEATFLNGIFNGEYIEYKKNGKVKRRIEDTSTEYPYK